MDGYGRKSERIAGEVRAAILAGRFRPGERIESENELAARYQVSRQTVRKALATLIEQGYLRAEHGRGTVNYIAKLRILLRINKFLYIKMKSHTLKYQYFIYFQYPTACYTQHQNRDIISLNATSII